MRCVKILAAAWVFLAAPWGIASSIARPLLNQDHRFQAEIDSVFKVGSKPPPVATAGRMSVQADGLRAFSFPAPALTNQELKQFVIGDSFFKRNWVEGPASTKARDGLGPHFIGRSCAACHVMDGRGAPPMVEHDVNIEPPVALLLRIAVLDAQGKAKPHPVYGEQIANAAVAGVIPEADIEIRYQKIQGQYPDGMPYELLKPTYTLKQLADGLMDSRLLDAKGVVQKGAVLLGPRIAPQLVGMGLIDAINPNDIILNARLQKKLRDEGNTAISGQVNWVWDVQHKRKRVGKFGWKANVPSLLQQTAAAFVNDIGITSSLFPKEPCTVFQRDCVEQRNSGQDSKQAAEISNDLLRQVVFYQAVLAPPERRHVNAKHILAGQKLFDEARCGVCHRPSYTTVSKKPRQGLNDQQLALFPPSSVLYNQNIWPYSDFLLHDMGEGLADGKPDGQANGKQWKTPPLWGIGLIQSVNGHSRLLHDGRARNIEEAILWHGGEAETSQKTFKSMTREQREALIAFVESL